VQHATRDAAGGWFGGGVSTHTLRHERTRTRTRTHTHTHTHTRTHSTRTRTSTSTSTHAHAHAHTHTRACAHGRTRTQADPQLAHRFGDGRDRCASVSTQSTRSIGPSALTSGARWTSFSTRPPAHKRKPTHAYPRTHGQVGMGTCGPALSGNGRATQPRGAAPRRLGPPDGVCARPWLRLSGRTRGEVQRSWALYINIKRQPATHQAWTRVGGGGVHSPTSSRRHPSFGAVHGCARCAAPERDNHDRKARQDRAQTADTRARQDLR
jgi:hypothetical protein